MARLLSQGTCNNCTNLDTESNCEVLTRRLATKADRSATVSLSEFRSYQETTRAQIRALQLLIIDLQADIVDLQTRVTALENP